MRLSFLVSILMHVLLLWGLLTMLDIVPQPRLPKTVYNVKILAPLIAARRQQAAPAPEVAEKPAPAKPKETVPKPKPKEKKPEKKPEPAQEEPKAAPNAAEQGDQPMGVSVGQPGDQTSMVVDAPQFPFSYYLSAIERKVSEHWFSSNPGRGEGVSCIVYFQLGRGGQISGVRVEQSSGNPHFDRQAVRAIQSAEPFPPLPRAFGEAWLGIHFTFVQKK